MPHSSWWPMGASCPCSTASMRRRRSCRRRRLMPSTRRLRAGGRSWSPTAAASTRRRCCEPAAPAAGYPRVAPYQYEPGQARRWLTFLARHLQHTRTSDFVWWQLPDAIPRLTRGLIFGLPPALIFAIAGELAGGYAVGIVYGVAFTLAGVVTNSLGRRPGPLRVELRFRGTGPRFLGRFAIGLVIGVGLGLGWSLPSDP